jgi:hypothetical protein
MARQERQAEKRARRQGRAMPEPEERGDARGPSDLPPGIGQYPQEIGRYPDEDATPAQDANAAR